MRKTLKNAPYRGMKHIWSNKTALVLFVCRDERIERGLREWMATMIKV